MTRDKIPIAPNCCCWTDCHCKYVVWGLRNGLTLTCLRLLVVIVPDLPQHVDSYQVYGGVAGFPHCSTCAFKDVRTYQVVAGAS